MTLEDRVQELAQRGRYQTPECSYLAARLEFIAAEDPADSDRAFRRMVSYVTRTVPDLDRMRADDW